MWLPGICLSRSNTKGSLHEVSLWSAIFTFRCPDYTKLSGVGQTTANIMCYQQMYADYMNEFLVLPVTHRNLRVTIWPKASSRESSTSLTMFMFWRWTCGLEVRTSGRKSHSQELSWAVSDALVDFRLVIWPEWANLFIYISSSTSFFFCCDLENVTQSPWTSSSLSKMGVTMDSSQTALKSKWQDVPIQTLNMICTLGVGGRCIRQWVVMTRHIRLGFSDVERN